MEILHLSKNLAAAQINKNIIYAEGPVNTDVNIMLIGCGLHAMRAYYPVLEEYQSGENVNISCIVDLIEKKQAIMRYISTKRTQPEEVYLLEPNETSFTELQDHVREQLDESIEKYSITGIIISTEPLSHMVYARWALRRGLSILMDKPISTKEHVFHNLQQAQTLTDEYQELVNLYTHAQMRNPMCTFSIMTHRRFHRGFIKIRELIKEVFERTNCPVTSVITEHADGEWRMPEEIIGQSYHPYNQGYGIFSHSGYHYLNMVMWLIEAAQSEQKNVDNVDIFAHFVRPSDYINQLTVEDFEKLFGEEYLSTHDRISENDFVNLTKNYGEIDGFASLSFKKRDRVMTVANINMIHNSFSRRGWSNSSGRNLYTGNGRVRHESYHLQQGPFQAIKLHSFRSTAHDQKDGSYALGGENHFDIHIFRNSTMCSDWKPVETITIEDLSAHKEDSLSHRENAKKRCILQFIHALQRKTPRRDMVSDLMSHCASVYLLSGIYQSAIFKQLGQNPVINVPLAACTNTGV